MRSRIWLAISLSAIGFGTGGVANRAALLEGADAYTIIALRMVLATTILFGYLLWKRRGLSRSRRVWWRAWVLGVVGLGIPMILLTLAVNYVSAGLVGLAIGLSSIITVLWAHFLLEGERLDIKVMAGMLVGLSGVIVLLVGGDTGIIGGNFLRGGSMALGGVVLTGLTSALARRYMLSHSVLDLAGPEFLLGTAVGLAAWPVFGHFDLGSLTASAWLLIAYLGVVGTIVPFLAFLWASQLASATRVSVVGYIVPVIALAGGVVFLDERVTWLIAIGGALITVGVVVVDRVEASRGAETAASPAPGSHV